MKSLKIRRVVVACLLTALLWMPAFAVQAADGSPAGFFAQWTGWWTAWIGWRAPETESVQAPTAPARQSVMGAGEAEMGVELGSPASPVPVEGLEEEGDKGGELDPYG